MKKFKFVNEIEPLEICGKEYRIEAGDVDLISVVMAKKDSIQHRLNSIDTKSDLDQEKIDKLLEVLKDAIDTFLGDGEFERIFNHEECNRNVRYITAVSNFIVDHINSQQ